MPKNVLSNENKFPIKFEFSVIFSSNKEGNGAPYIVRKRFSLSFNDVPQSFTQIFGIKSVVGPEVRYPGT